MPRQKRTTPLNRQAFYILTHQTTAGGEVLCPKVPQNEKSYPIATTVVPNPSKLCIMRANSLAGPCLLLARAVDDTQAALIGNQGGGRVWLFFETDNIDRDYAAWTRSGVRFHEPVRSEVYGRVAVFEDLYGNRFDLIESRR